MRFVQALLISLALHGSLLLVPSGTTSQVGRVSPWANQAAAQGKAAPLQVRLSPFATIRPPEERQPAESPLLATIPSAHSIAQDSAGAGGEGTLEAASAAAPPAERLPLGIPTARYYEPSEVSRGVLPLTEIDPSPNELAEVADAGSLVLVLYISDNGRVDRVEIEQQKGDPAIGAIVAKQFLAALFTPAEVEGRPVKSRLRIEVTVRPRRP